MLWVKQKQYQPPTTERKRLEHKKKGIFLRENRFRNTREKYKIAVMGGKRLGKRGNTKRREY